MTTPTEKTISANTAEEILKLENVSCAYHTESGETLAVDDLSFSAKKGVTNCLALSLKSITN